MNRQTMYQVEKETIGLLEHIDLVLVRLPFVTPFGTSVQVWTHKEALLLRVQDHIQLRET